MAVEETTLALLSSLAGQVPLLLVYFAGIGWAIYRWKEMPRPALLLTIGLTLFILLAFLSTATSFVPLMIMDNGGDVGDTASIMSGLACISTLVAAVASALVVWAVFADRSEEIGY